MAASHRQRIVAWPVGAATPPVPTGLVLTPVNPTVPDSSTAGAQVTIATVTMSDGSTFTGPLTVTGPA